MMTDLSRHSVRFFMPHEAYALIAAAKESRFSNNPHTAIIIELLFGLGAQAREVVKLDPKDIDLTARRVVIRGNKNDEGRQSLLAERTVAVLEAHPAPADGGPVIRAHKGEPYAVRTCGGKQSYGVKFCWWPQAVEEIGLDPCAYTPKIARSSWAIWRYAEYPNMYAVVHEGGWKAPPSVLIDLDIPLMDVAAEAASFGWRWLPDDVLSRPRLTPQEALEF